MQAYFKSSNFEEDAINFEISKEDLRIATYEAIMKFLSLALIKISNFELYLINATFQSSSIPQTKELITIIQLLEALNHYSLLSKEGTCTELDVMDIDENS